MPAQVCKHRIDQLKTRLSKYREKNELVVKYHKAICPCKSTNTIHHPDTKRAAGRAATNRTGKN